MNDETQDESMATDTRPEGPGRRLRSAREEKGLSCEEAAAGLRLTTRLVRALEEDDLDALPPFAFVAGYLRSYGRLLELPPEELVDAYQRHLPDAEPSLVSSIKHRDQVRSSDLPVRLTTYGIVLVLVGLLSAWWIAQRQTDDPLTGDEAAVEQPDDSAPVAVSGPAAPEPAEPPDAPPPASEPAPSSKPVAASPPLEPPVSVAEDESDGAAAEPDIENAPAELQADEPAVEEEEAGPPPLTPQMAQATVELEFSEDCWAEVHDAAGRRLLYDLARAGRSLRLRGEAPFKIFLGYAPGATVYYQGEQYSHERFQRGDVARFTVGKQEDNEPLVESTDVDAG